MTPREFSLIHLHGFLTTLAWFSAASPRPLQCCLSLGLVKIASPTSLQDRIGKARSLIVMCFSHQTSSAAVASLDGVYVRRREKFILWHDTAPPCWVIGIGRPKRAPPGNMKIVPGSEDSEVHEDPFPFSYTRTIGWLFVTLTCFLRGRKDVELELSA